MPSTVAIIWTIITIEQNLLRLLLNNNRISNSSIIHRHLTTIPTLVQTYLFGASMVTIMKNSIAMNCTNSAFRNSFMLIVKADPLTKTISLLRMSLD